MSTQTLLFLLSVIGMFLIARNFDKVLDWVGSYFIERPAPAATGLQPALSVQEPTLSWMITKCTRACVDANRSGVCMCDVVQLSGAALKGQVPSDWRGRPLEMTDLVDREAEFALRDTVFVMWATYYRGNGLASVRFVASTYLPKPDESHADIARILAEQSVAQPFTFSYRGGEVVPSNSLADWVAWTMLVAFYDQPDAD